MYSRFTYFIIGFIILSVSSSYATERIIIIDVSHGGKDDGIEVNGFREKDLTFEIALKIQSLNKADDLKIILTRQGDYFLSLEERVDFIKSVNPDFVISLHINSSTDSSQHGFDLFVSSKHTLNDQSIEFARKIENSLSNHFSSNGIKESNFYILKNTNIPSATLEFGYLTNLGDRNLLTTELGQQKIAEAIYNVLK